MFDYPSWGLFLSAFLSSTLLPGGSEAVLAYLTRAQGHELGWLLVVASVGNTLGGMTSWLVGRLIAIRYPAEQIIASTAEHPADKSDEVRWASNEEKLHHEDTKSRSKPKILRVFVPSWFKCLAGDSGMKVRGTHPAELAGERVLPRPSSLAPRPSPKALERLRRRGAPVLLLSWLPIIGDPLCVAAGWLRIHWLLSLVLIGIGKTVRYGVVVFLFSG